MTFLTTTAGASPAFLPEAKHQLITLPVEAASIAYQVATSISITEVDVRVPLVTGEPSAAWVAEGAEIPASDPTVSDLLIVPKKIAGLTAISREMAEDSNPAAQAIVGAGVANDIAKKVDAAFFGNTVTNGPAGLLSLTTSTVANVSAWANLDPFAEALSKQQAFGVKPTAFVANPADLLALAKLKEGTGSNKPLLGSDPTNPTRAVLQGVPALACTNVAPGTVWLIPAERVLIARRSNVELDVDKSVYFTSDKVAIRATLRIGWGFLQPLSIVKITLAA